MATFEVRDIATNELVATVEAATSSQAKSGYRHCKAVEVKKLLPGEAEYQRFLSWQNATRNADIEARNRRMDNYHLNIMGVATDNDAYYPEYPLTASETEAAGQYARFLGESVYREFVNAVPGKGE